MSFEVILFNKAKTPIHRQPCPTPQVAKQQAFECWDRAREAGFSGLSLGFYENGKLKELCSSRPQIMRFETEEAR